jgi:L-seryl-tRNA(Ser) seleniumtransferase
MATPDKINRLLKSLPKVDILADSLSAEVSRKLRVSAARKAIDTLRKKILSSKPEELDCTEISMNEVERLGIEALNELMSPSLVPVVNATGVVIHTNLGRSPLPEDVLGYMADVARGYSNLEYDLEDGRRGSRYSHVEDIVCELTGAESALVVNNNAAAVLISLETLAKGQEVIVSRGELVEIGGSFRIPDVMARSGAILKEVGATNRTHLRDYEGAITDDTALLLKVHQSNFAISGFTKAVSVAELKELASKYGLPVMEDLGSGTFTDFALYGMKHEPTVQEAVEAGADIVTFSGDKLLGGPQAGIIVGKKELVDRIKRNPMNRAMRIDKLTLAALEGILNIYRDPEEAVKRIPTLRMLTADASELENRAKSLHRLLSSEIASPFVNIEVIETVSRVGGGALPLQELVSFAVGISVSGEDSGLSASMIEAGLRRNNPPVIVRLQDDMLVFDVRTIAESEFRLVADALKRLL